MGLGGISLWQIFILLFVFFVGALPWILALVSKKAEGTNKVVWFLMSFFISWLGYLVYYFLVIKKLPENN
ncbi:hypothetical protein PTRA_a2448 [Pseudoalteromonas translucida KMM 520]|uniref:Cardiolipin synthase N-terminal domain-containing protein n=1 Tax=Pseudoalteromonas translucida KMM 520 TaxID=1315283 RepID=A0A0U2NHU9_9GAMM|nr:MULTISPECIES: hypothetical protein [Pseudoalteromonas]ALS33539.1 hypothetical protein PTRA_a2448 [Pseudoalteromonas translucida KMM 520]TMO69795.1 hypothetical protein CWC17_18905 [Pseudoalteromonas sp. S3785]